MTWPGTDRHCGYRYFLYQIDPLTGATLHVYDGPPGGPGGMAIKDELLYVTSWWDNQVYVYEIPEPASFLFATLGWAIMGFRKAGGLLQIGARCNGRVPAVH